MSGRESGKIVEKSGPNSIRWLPKMCRFAGKVFAQFKLSTFNGTAPTVQNYPFVGFQKVLYLRTNSVVVGKIERNLKPRVVAVGESRRSMQSLTKCPTSVPLITHTNSDLRVKPGNTNEFLSRSVSSRLEGKINA